MGCDIHFVVEKQYGDKWVGVYCPYETPAMATATDDEYLKGSLYERQPVFKHRSYEFFARLAGVRGDGPDPKGVPDDVSELAQIHLDHWGGDGHSHSWDTLEMFVRKYDAGDIDPTAAAVRDRLLGEDANKRIQKLAGLYDSDDLSNYRVIYWFDN